MERLWAIAWDSNSDQEPHIARRYGLIQLDLLQIAKVHRIAVAAKLRKTGAVILGKLKSLN